ncbi:MAG: serine/threonine-protein phosphatase [Ruminococcus sp.]|nr:serine/threonine-protein phosphatase [Ruminococcus sp.]
MALSEEKTVKLESGGRTELLVSIATNVGNVRQVNEDNFYADKLGVREVENLCGYKVLSHSERYVFAVFDGMGGEQFGDLASEIAAKTLDEYADSIIAAESPEEMKDAVDRFASEANDRIVKMVDDMNGKLGGCTLAMVCTIGSQAYVFNIGDSRIYFYTNENGLRQVSEDQTLAMKKLKANIYTEEEARLSEDAHKITSFLGVDSRNIGMKALSYEPVDLYEGALLLCSDGLTDMVSDEDISGSMSDMDKEIAPRLVDQALENGGLDNVTCMVIYRAQ